MQLNFNFFENKYSSELSKQPYAMPKIGAINVNFNLIIFFV